MRLSGKALLGLAVLAAFSGYVDGQFDFLRNIFRPPSGRGGGLFGGLFGGGGRFTDDGTQSPQATGRDELFPRDCGREPDKGTGKLCFPDGILCQNRLNRAGVERYGNHNYWLSWRSDDPSLSGANWDWFNARNYCRKRCMDLVSFETRDEYEYFKNIAAANNVKFFWTSGRLCDFDGCDRPEFFPKNINGWFWSANQVKFTPSNSNSGFHDWSHTGGNGARQPDNREGGESCMAVLNNFYNDGIKWHDVACHHEKPIICEDVEGHLQYARQQFPNIRIP